MSKGMSSKRNVIILAAVLVVVIIGAVIAAVAVGSDGKTDIAETLTLAERYLNEENYEQAIIEFERIIEIDPMNTDAYIGKAEALIALGRTDEAAELLEEAYELTGSEKIKEFLDELNEPEETQATTTAAATTTVITTTTTVPTTATSTEAEVAELDYVRQEADYSIEMAELPYEDEYCHSVEVMLFNFFYRDGDLDVAMLRSVTSLEVYGASLFIVKCGDKTGTLADWNVWKGDEANQEITLFLKNGDKVTCPYGNITVLDFAKYLTNCTEITIECNTILEVASLSGLTQLQKLKIGDNSAPDSEMEELKELLPNCTFY